MPLLFEFESIYELKQSFELIDDFADCLTLPTRPLTINLPCQWRDAFAVDGTRSMVEVYRDKLHIPIEDALHRAQPLKKLNAAAVLVESDGIRPAPVQKDIVRMFRELKTVHKAIVLYLWFSHRHPVAFLDQEKGFQTRHLAEVAMD